MFLYMCYNQAMFGDLSFNWLLVLAGFSLIAAELFVGVDTGFDLVLIGLSFLAGGFIGNLLDQSYAGIIATTILTFAYIILGRKLIKSRLIITTHKTNIDSLIGKSGFVVKTILPNKRGQIAVSGELWLAESDQKIDEGTKIEVISIEGITLKVLRKGGEK